MRARALQPGPYVWHPDDIRRAAENCRAYRERWKLDPHRMGRQCNTNAGVIEAIEAGLRLAPRFTQCVGYVLHLRLEKPPRDTRGVARLRWDWPVAYWAQDTEPLGDIEVSE